MDVWQLEPLGMIIQVIRSGFDTTVVLTWLIQMVALLTAVTLHEVAHGYAALKVGDPTARDMGRLTLNPLAHFDLIGGLLIVLGAPVAWAKPVPVNTARFDQKRPFRRAMMIVAIAGVVTNLVTAFISFFLRALLIRIAFGLTLEPLLNVFGILILFFERLALISVFLAVFNMLPVPPLDGFKFFGQFMSPRIYNTLLRYERQIGMVFLFLIIFGRNYLWIVLDRIASPILWVLQAPIVWFFNLF